jgi:hypothetical protein
MRAIGWLVGLFVISAAMMFVDRLLQQGWSIVASLLGVAGMISSVVLLLIIVPGVLKSRLQNRPPRSAS